MIILPKDYSAQLISKMNDIEELNLAMETLSKIDRRTCVRGDKLNGLEDTIQSLRMEKHRLVDEYRELKRLAEKA